MSSLRIPKYEKGLNWTYWPCSDENSTTSSEIEAIVKELLNNLIDQIPEHPASDAQSIIEICVDQVDSEIQEIFHQTPKPVSTAQIYSPHNVILDNFTLQDLSSQDLIKNDINNNVIECFAQTLAEEMIQDLLNEEDDKNFHSDHDDPDELFLVLHPPHEETTDIPGT